LVCDDGLVLWIQAAGLLTFTVDGFKMLTIQQLKSTTPNHRHRPSTIKLLAPVTVDISVSMGYSELKMKPSTVNVNNPAA
jgi:hypothetical protein